MNLAFLGGFGRQPFAAGWQKETAVAVFGGGEIDLTAAPPGPNARLTAVAVLGGIEISVPAGSRITMSGMSLLGGREIKLTPGDGPEFHLRAIAILGGVKVKEGAGG